MCGITGWFTASPLDPQAAAGRLAAMMHALAHRGPDGEGRAIFAHAALGHRRLSIIDLTTGDQPMASPDGRCQIVYNGEIYNYEALRSPLIAAGYPFRTHSDTEVILALYQTEGWRGFEKLRGMYAFALWDEAARTGWLVRDPLGIKPLFVAEGAHGELAFGSEAKALLAGGMEARLNPGALHLLMNFRYVPGEASLFEGVTQLAPGDVRRWRPGERSEVSHLSAGGTEEGDLTAAMDRSVQAHLTADVEVGGYLSGGIDSAAISAFASRRTGSVYRTFTLEVGDDPNEAANARATAQLLGIQNLTAREVEQPEQTLAGLIHKLEAPKVNSWQIAELARFASRHVKVALSGLGGDELFFGYNLHGILAAAVETERWTPRLCSRVLGGAGGAVLRALGRAPWTEGERAGAMLASLGNWPRVYGLVRNVWDQPRLREAFYGPRLLDQPLPSAFEWIEHHWPERADPVEAVSAFEWRNKMVNDLLWQEDRCAMAHGLEVRTPFVDRELASAVGRYRREDLMPGRRLKGKMREALGGILPPEILNRRKSGFQVEAGRFFHQQLAPLASTWLSEERVSAYGLFNPAFVRRIRTSAARKGLRWHFFMLYLMLGAHLWVEIFEGRHDPHRLVP